MIDMYIQLMSESAVSPANIPRRGYVDTDWGQIHYQRAGTSGPTIVLLHESPMSSMVYHHVIPKLSESLEVFAFDTPGYGMSDGPSSPTDIQAYAGQMHQAIQGLGIEGFAIAGSHTGAAIAIELAVNLSDRVTHLVLTGIPLLSDQARKERLASRIPPVDVRGDGEHQAWVWRRFQNSMGKDTPPLMVNMGAVHMLANPVRYPWAYRAAYNYDPTPKMPRIQCPTLVLHADGDKLGSASEEAMSLLPNGELEVVPGFSGKLPLRAPDLYSERVCRFIRVSLNT